MAQFRLTWTRNGALDLSQILDHTGRPLFFPKNGSSVVVDESATKHPLLVAYLGNGLDMVNALTGVPAPAVAPPPPPPLVPEPAPVIEEVPPPAPVIEEVPPPAPVVEMVVEAPVEAPVAVPVETPVEAVIEEVAPAPLAVEVVETPAMEEVVAPVVEEAPAPSTALLETLLERSDDPSYSKKSKRSKK